MDSQRFEQLWKRNQRLGSTDCAHSVFTQLEKHYNESHRYYHTAAHIDHCLRQVDHIPQDYSDRDAVELAIWFHDVIYQIGDSENEENSANWFMDVSSAELDEDLRSQVYRLILATQHTQQPDGQDAQYVVDIDLSGFGMSWSAFSADSARVRQEFPDVADNIFAEKHRSFLKMLAEREFFFCSSLFRELYETQAKQNIVRKLASLA